MPLLRGHKQGLTAVTGFVTLSHRPGHFGDRGDLWHEEESLPLLPSLAQSVHLRPRSCIVERECDVLYTTSARTTYISALPSLACRDSS